MSAQFEKTINFFTWIWDFLSELMMMVWSIPRLKNSPIPSDNGILVSIKESELSSHKKIQRKLKYLLVKEAALKRLHTV